MSTREPKVSVVTPFHNTAPYLRECIDSVLAQTHANFEYVLVDNESSDGSSEIAADYVGRDERVRLIRTGRLLTQVENYNHALAQIADDAGYCKMCQADDWLYPRCLEDLVRLAEAHPEVSVVSSYYLRESEVMNTGLHPSVSVLTGAAACRLHLMQGVFLFGTPTTVLYRADVVRSRRPFFETGRLHEDTEAVMDILRTRDFGFVHQILSFSRMQAESITGRNRDLLPEALDRTIVVRRFGPAFLDAAEHRACWDNARQQYYQSLARRWLRGLLRRGRRDFWDYQRRGLATVGEKVDGPRLARAIAKVIARGLLNPIGALDAIKRMTRGA